MSQVNVTRTPLQLQGTVSFDVANLDSIINQIGNVTESLAGRVVSTAFLQSIIKATPQINKEIIKSFFAQPDVQDAFTPGQKLNAALGLARNLSSKEALSNYIGKSLLTGEAAGRGQLRDVIGSRPEGQLTRNAFFGFQKGITPSSFAQQTFGSYESVSRGRGRAGSQILSAGRTNTINWLEMLVSPERGRIPGFSFRGGKPSDPDMSGSRTGYGVMRFGGSFSIKPFLSDPNVRKLGIVEALFSEDSRLFSRVRKIFDPIFDSELSAALAKENKKLRGRGRGASSLSTAEGTIDIGTGGAGGRTTASLRSDFADDSPVQGTGEGGVRVSSNIQRLLGELRGLGDPGIQAADFFAEELSTSLKVDDIVESIIGVRDALKG